MSHATTTIGRVQVHRWPAIDAERLVAHGLSPGERAVVEDFETVVEGPGLGELPRFGKAQTIDAVASFAERVATR